MMTTGMQGELIQAKVIMLAMSYTYRRWINDCNE